MPLLAKGLLFVSALASIYLSCLELTTTVKFADILYISSEATAHIKSLPEILREYSPAVDQIRDGNVCRSDIIRAGLDISLAELDSESADRDFEAWLLSIQRAQRMVQHAIQCGPTTSEYWTRYAMISFAGGENSMGLASLLNRAVMLDPTNTGALRARFSIWRKLSSDSLSIAGGALNSDLQTLLTYGGKAEMRDILSPISTSMRPYVIMRFCKLDLDRRARLLRWGFEPSGDKSISSNSSEICSLEH